MTISSKVAVAIFVLVAVAGSGALAIVLDAQAAAERREFRRAVAQNLELLSSAVTRAVATGHHDVVQSILDNAIISGKRTEVKHLEIVNRHGRVIADLDPRRFNVVTDLHELKKDLYLRAPKLTVVDNETTAFVVPIRVTYPLGVLRATVSEARVLDGLRAAQRNAGALALGTSALLAFALYFVLRRVVASRLVALAVTARNYREGRLDVRATMQGADEIAQLADAFNQMASSIRAYTEKLETLVEERTQALSQANKKLEHLATTDSLTALYNRRYFEEQAKRDLELARRESSPFALVMMDVDRFKQLNDKHGHFAGDEVLQAVGRVLADSARTTDIVARIGGEEFAIAMPNTDVTEAFKAAERLRQQIAALSSASLHAVKPGEVTASFGVAGFPLHADTLPRLLAAADTALYGAKRAGRNRVAVAGGPVTAELLEQHHDDTQT